MAKKEINFSLFPRASCNEILKGSFSYRAGRITIKELKKYCPKYKYVLIRHPKYEKVWKIKKVK
jgi:hypothetical protein